MHESFEKAYLFEILQIGKCENIKKTYRRWKKKNRPKMNPRPSKTHGLWCFFPCLPRARWRLRAPGTVRSVCGLAGACQSTFSLCETPNHHMIRSVSCHVILYHSVYHNFRSHHNMIYHSILRPITIYPILS